MRDPRWGRAQVCFLCRPWHSTHAAPSVFFLCLFFGVGSAWGGPFPDWRVCCQRNLSDSEWPNCSWWNTEVPVRSRYHEALAYVYVEFLFCRALHFCYIATNFNLTSKQIFFLAVWEISLRVYHLSEQVGTIYHIMSSACHKSPGAAVQNAHCCNIIVLRIGNNYSHVR